MSDDERKDSSTGGKRSSDTNGLRGTSRHGKAPCTTPLILAIDQGTTSTRAILFDAAGQERHSPRLELHQHYPRPGWVEHDPEEIWRAVAMTCRAAVTAAADAPIAAIGITNQRETAVLWERA